MNTATLTSLIEKLIAEAVEGLLLTKEIVVERASPDARHTGSDGIHKDLELPKAELLGYCRRNGISRLELFGSATRVDQCWIRPRQAPIWFTAVVPIDPGRCP
jgi:hypothetical protein